LADEEHVLLSPCTTSFGLVSMGVLFKELSTLYGAFVRGKEIAGGVGSAVCDYRCGSGSGWKAKY